VPDIYAAPKEVEVSNLENTKNRFGTLNSKAIGQPPLMYGIVAYFAICNAIRPGIDLKLDAPMTPERVLVNVKEAVVSN